MSTNHQRRYFIHCHRQVNAGIWKACAGTSVQIPTVNSRVYYFPQGHVEQSSSSISLPLLSSPPSIPCRVLHVLHLADPDTDEVFAKIRLQPILTLPPSRRFDFDNDSSHFVDDVIVSFAKVLTPSDVNNGGGFSVPRCCADSIFPPLEYAADPPVQNLRIADIHGEFYEFRHIYRGMPRRHLLTTGWSKFVNSKKLIAGDSVVFIRNKETDELLIGVRRAVKSNERQNWGLHCGGGISVGPTGGGITRNGKGRVPPEAVIEAVERAGSNMTFEVVYYPRGGLPEFVVDAEKVERAMRVFWRSGMRVKMAVETEDSSKIAWFKGTVASLIGPGHGIWHGSMWHMLEIAWDEPEALQNKKRVSPWQLEVVNPMPSYPTVSPPTNKFPLNSPYLNYDISPSSIQGARQNRFIVSSLQNIINHNPLQMCADDCMDDMSPNVGVVSTDLSIGSTLSDTSSPNLQLFGIETTPNNSCNLAGKVGITSFQLFGKIIHI